MKIGAVILCGGKSRRMGIEKSSLPIGEETFTERILKQLQNFDEVLLSINKTQQNLPQSYPHIMDQYPECGPMGGLHAALSACHSAALLAVACDLPLFRRELGELLCQSMEQGMDAVISVSPDGRIHPLCAVYKKEVSAVLEQRLLGGQYRLMDALEQMNVRYVTVPESLADCLRNINTPEEYKEIAGMCQIFLTTPLLQRRHKLPESHPQSPRSAHQR